jgi:rubredoxin/uncharacterized membrane protein
MKKQVICRVCGYVMDEDDLKEVCPVCGVKKTAFVEYKNNVSETRQKILDLHIHPILVHFPEAIAVFSVGFLILSFLTTGSISENFVITTKVLTYFFPLTVIIASLSGVYDAKVRFKKLSPPYLKTKIYLGIILFVTSIIILLLMHFTFTNTIGKVLILIFAFFNLGLCAYLGKMGGKMINSKMPG